MLVWAAAPRFVLALHGVPQCDRGGLAHRGEVSKMTALIEGPGDDVRIERLVRREAFALGSRGHVRSFALRPAVLRRRGARAVSITQERHASYGPSRLA